MTRAHWRSGVAPLLLLIAGLCMVRTQSLAWGAADAADGTRYKLSPTALSHVLQPRQMESPTIPCGWATLSARRLPPCEFGPGSRDPMRRLSLVALLLVVASVVAIGAALVMLRAGDRRVARAVAAAAPGVILVAASLLFRPAARELFASIGATNGDFGGMGWYLVHLAPALAAVAALLEWQRSGREAAAPAVVLGAATVFLAVLLLAPRPLGNSVALVSSFIGLAVGVLLVLGRFLRRAGPGGAQGTAWANPPATP